MENMTRAETSALMSSLMVGSLVVISLEGGDCIDRLEVDGLSFYNGHLSGVGFKDNSDLVKIDDKWFFFPDRCCFDKEKGTVVAKISISSNS